jgi:hypothetical protein
MAGQLLAMESSTRLELNGQRPAARQPARITRSDRASSLALLYDISKRSFLIGTASSRAERAWISLRYRVFRTEKEHHLEVVASGSREQGGRGGGSC